MFKHILPTASFLLSWHHGIGWGARCPPVTIYQLLPETIPLLWTTKNVLYYVTYLIALLAFTVNPSTDVSDLVSLRHHVNPLKTTRILRRKIVQWIVMVPKAPQNIDTTLILEQFPLADFILIAEYVCNINLPWAIWPVRWWYWVLKELPVPLRWRPRPL